MRYTEPKERSAELLRLALGHMGKHAAAFNPATFALWYEYAAGTNPGLQAALDRLVHDKTPIDDATVVKLFHAHVAPADAEAMERIGSDFERVLGSLSETASTTGVRAGRFGVQLADLSAALLSSDPAQIAPQLDDARVGTEEMKTSVQTLQHEVINSQTEILRLRDDLDRSRSEALVDPLTDIMSRKGFDQHLAALLEQPAEAGRQHCLVMLDVDHFKKVNDTHGHLMGDRVIQGLGEILRQSAAIEDHTVARFGGEEFAIVLKHSSLDEAAQLAEAVRARAKAMKIRHRSTQEVMFSITVSGGVTALQKGDNADTLIARADAALRKAKQAGRDRVARS
jgi:diguanylate cyclase